MSRAEKKKAEKKQKKQSAARFRWDGRERAVEGGEIQGRSKSSRVNWAY